jgi:hypothetical protein
MTLLIRRDLATLFNMNMVIHLLGIHQRFHFVSLDRQQGCHHTAEISILVGWIGFLYLDTLHHIC